MRKAVAVAVLVAVAGIAAGCDSYKESQGTLDAPIVRTEREGWVVMASPDHFPNLAFRCFGPNGIYNPRTAEKDGARMVTVVPNDPQCKR